MDAQQQQQQQRQEPRVRIRTITCFVRMPSSAAGDAAADAAAAAAAADAQARVLAGAGEFLARARAAFEAAGYDVQTVRVATQPFDQYLGSPGPALPAAAAALEAAALAAGVPLLSLGGAGDPAYLPWIPPMLAATSNVSLSFELLPSHGNGDPASPESGAAAATGEVSPSLARRAAAAALQVAALTGGRRNFGFAAAAGCRRRGIPFFPVATASAADGFEGAFGIGLEADALLPGAFQAARRAFVASGGGDGSSAAEREALPVPARFVCEALATALAPTLRRVADAAASAAAAAATAEAATRGQASLSRFDYAGVDISIAPGLDTPALADSIEMLMARGARFGGPGTLAACETVTRALKAVQAAANAARAANAAKAADTPPPPPLPLQGPIIGYSGLMLAVCEDLGLAAAAAARRVAVPGLLQWSAVCGCGLDTVPVPGPGPGWARVYAAAEPGAAAAAGRVGTSSGDGGGADGGGSSGANQMKAEGGGGGDGGGGGEGDDGRDERLLRAYAGVVLDTAHLARRLGKPLAVRLLPVPGAAPGDATAFDSPYLCQSRVMALE